MTRRAFVFAASAVLLVSSALAHEPAAHVAELKTELKLSGAQARRLLAVFEESARKIEPLRAEIRQAQDRVKAAGQDATARKAAEQKLEDLNRRRQELAAEREAAMKAILTAEQFAAFKKKQGSRASAGGAHP